MTGEAIERAERQGWGRTTAYRNRSQADAANASAENHPACLGFGQEEFSARYHIPLGTLRDWEQGRAEPDQPTRAYLTLIARDPDHVNRTLNPKAS